MYIPDLPNNIFSFPGFKYKRFRHPKTKNLNFLLQLINMKSLQIDC
jgi:hypothetical protein